MARDYSFVISGEFFHLAFKVLKNRQKAKIVNEIIVSSLFPRGVLGEKFFKNKLTDKIHLKASEDQTKKILRLTENFVLRNKAFDEKYVKIVKMFCAKEIITAPQEHFLFSSSLCSQENNVAHKGKIWAESEGEGKGSRFFVEMTAVENTKNQS